MEKEEYKHGVSGYSDYDIAYFVKKFGISETEVELSLAEIHYSSAEELEDYLKVKYRS